MERPQPVQRPHPVRAAPRAGQLPAGQQPEAHRPAAEQQPGARRQLAAEQRPGNADRSRRTSSHQ
ncbi:hypothetical protein I546_2504 [Mycobacterium kansasii 732]|nr:hypothetical protein I546_2504 [Mycobacterium kansasii 732]